MLFGETVCPDDVDWSALEDRQRRQLGALALFSDICERHNIRYLLLAGNVLGFKRHGGFIPWDDDVDIGLFRPDYERLIEVLKREPRCRFCNWLCDDDYKLWFTKFAVNVDGKQQFDKNDFIDVFPIDRATSNKVIYFLQKLIIRVLINCEIFQKCKARGYRLPLYGLISFFLPKSVVQLRRIIEKWALNSTSFREKGICGPLLDQYGERTRLPFEVWWSNKESQEIEFCGVKCYQPAQTDRYLESIYGNWRQFPPFEARRPKHDGDGPWFYSEME